MFSAGRGSEAAQSFQAREPAGGQTKGAREELAAAKAVEDTRRIEGVLKRQGCPEHTADRTDAGSVPTLELAWSGPTGSAGARSHRTSRPVCQREVFVGRAVVARTVRHHEVAHLGESCLASGAGLAAELVAGTAAGIGVAGPGSSCPTAAATEGTDTRHYLQRQWTSLCSDDTATAPERSPFGESGRHGTSWSVVGAAAQGVLDRDRAPGTETAAETSCWDAADAAGEEKLADSRG